MNAFGSEKRARVRSAISLVQPSTMPIAPARNHGRTPGRERLAEVHSSTPSPPIPAMCTTP